MRRQHAGGSATSGWQGAGRRGGGAGGAARRRVEREAGAGPGSMWHSARLCEPGQPSSRAGTWLPPTAHACMHASPRQARALPAAVKACFLRLVLGPYPQPRSPARVQPQAAHVAPSRGAQLAQLHCAVVWQCAWIILYFQMGVRSVPQVQVVGCAHVERNNASLLRAFLAFLGPLWHTRRSHQLSQFYPSRLGR